MSDVPKLPPNDNDPDKKQIPPGAQEGPVSTPRETDLQGRLARLQELVNDLTRQLLAGPLTADLAELIRKEIAAAKGPADPRDTVTVNEVVEKYFLENPDELLPEVLADRVNVCRRFAVAHGSKRVEDCRPLDLSGFLREQESWKSPWTKKRGLAHIKRLFRWAVEVRLIWAYPFQGVKAREGARRRPMTDDDFQLMMRSNPARLRRLFTFLRFTGCRPSEASKMRWSNVDFERNIVVLQEHKTQKKTGKPRTLFLHPVVVKLLRWLDRHRPTNPARWLAALLVKHGSMRTSEISKLAKEANLSPYLVYKAARAIGAKKQYRGPRSARGRHRLYLPGPPNLADAGGEHEQNTFVFLNLYGGPWTCSNLSRLYQRMKKRGLKYATLYQLRHRFGTEACKRGLNLKVVALLMGHARITTTEWYVDTLGEDISLLLAQIQRVLPGLSRRGDRHE